MISFFLSLTLSLSNTHTLNYFIQFHSFSVSGWISFAKITIIIEALFISNHLHKHFSFAHIQKNEFRIGRVFYSHFEHLKWYLQFISVLIFAIYHFLTFTIIIINVNFLEKDSDA